MVSVHRWTGDLVGVLGLSFFAGVVVLEGGAVPSPLRVVAVLPLLLVVPGYALVSLLFPETTGADPDRSGGSPSLEHPGGSGSLDASNRPPSLGVVERFVLSVALSVAVVPSVAFVLNFTTYGVRAEPIAAGVIAVTVACTLLALVARARVPAERRFGMAPAEWVAAVDRRSFRTEPNLREPGLFDARTGTQRVLNVVVVLSLLVLAASVAFAATVPTAPSNDAQFTEFYLLSENESGELVAEDYPRFDGGEARPIHVAIANHENREVTYTTVVLVERTTVEDGRVRVEASREVDRFRTTVEPGETKRVERRLRPALSGENVRFTFLLYRGEAPGDPSRGDAYRVTQLWVGGNASGRVAAPSADDGGRTGDLAPGTAD